MTGDWKLKYIEEIVKAGNNHDKLFKIIEDIYDSEYTDCMDDYNLDDEHNTPEPVPWEDLD
jgi:hypothetical protein